MDPEKEDTQRILLGKNCCQSESCNKSRNNEIILTDESNEQVDVEESNEHVDEQKEKRIIVDRTPLTQVGTKQNQFYA